MKTFVFPGQGSQFKGMGADLFDKFPEQTQKANEILGYSIKELCLEDPDNNLNQTQYTQPALYIVNALSYLDKIQSGAAKPDYVAGHSLGEYDAIFAAGGFDFETGLKLVQKRGELMSQASGGGMAAVMGMEPAEIRQMLDQNGFESIDIANLNCPGQIVVSGLKDDIKSARAAFKAEKKKYIPLKVSGAFHSRYMEASAQQFSAFLDEFTFSTLEIPVISNVTAEPYTNENLKENLTQQITSSVRWIESIGYLCEQGTMEFEEIGPGNVLTGLVAKITK